MLLFIWWNSSLKHPLIILLLSKVGQQATTGKLFESILQLKLLFGKEVSTWDCNNPMAHISKKEGQEKKAQTRKKIAFATSSARSNSCHSRSIYLKAAGRNNLTLQWILIWTFDECESYIGGSRKMLKSGTKPYAHSTNSPKWHGRRNLSAERKHYLSLHFLFVPKKFDFLFYLEI